jgi:hypothetical protein
VPSKRRLERLGKIEEWLHNQNRGVEKSKIETKIRTRLEVSKRDEVKIVLVENMTLLTRLAFLWLTLLRCHSITPSYKAKLIAHSMCAQK